MSSRRLELEAVLRCTVCRSVVYHLFRRQNHQPDGTPLPSFDNVLWPVHPNVPPPERPERIACPDCGTELRRAAP